MKIYYWIDTAEWSGAEKYLETLALDRLKRGDAVTLVLPRGFGLGHVVSRFEDRGVAVRKVEMRLYKRMASFLQALRLLLCERPDVNHFVLCFPNLCQLAALTSVALRIPTYITEQAVPPHRYGGPWAGRLKALIGRLCAKTICVSGSNRDDLIRFFKIPASKVTVIPNGVEVARFAPLPAQSGPARRSRLNLDAKLLVGVVSRIDERKGSDLFPLIAHRILTANADTHIIWAGEGIRRAKMARAVRRYGDEQRVRFLGHIDWVPEFMALVDLVMLPSRYEGLPFAVVEAMAAAKTVVAFDVSGNRDVIEDGITGYLIPPFDCRQFADRVLELLSQPGRRKDMGRAGYRRVSEKFSQRSMLIAVDQIYRKSAFQ